MMSEEKETTSLLRDSPGTEKLSYTGGAPGPGPAPASSGGKQSRETCSRSVINVADESMTAYPCHGMVDDGDAEHDSPESSDLHQIIMDDRSMEENKTTNMQTLMHIIKGNIGTGILALPMAVYHSGLWTGLAGILCIGAIAVHCMHVLIRCGHILCLRTGCTSLDYADVMEVCLRTGPQAGRRFSTFSRYLVNALLIFTQFGFCCVYIVFVATNVQTVISHFHEDGPGMLVYQLIVTAALIPYVCVRNLKMLAPFSAFANVLTVTGLVIIIQYIVQGLPDVSQRPAFSSFQQLPLFFGTAIFAVEGISLVLPLENSMKHPEDFGGWTGVLNLGMVTIVCLYAAIGFYGYLKFGPDIKDSITLSLPNDDWLYLSVMLMFAVAIFISYNVQFYVPIVILWPSIKHRLHNGFLRKYGEYPFRIVLVLVTFGFAAAVPHLDLLISLIGSFASSSLALILPALVEVLTLLAEGKSLPKYIVVKDVLIFLFGVVGCVLGTYTSLKEIIAKF